VPIFRPGHYSISVEQSGFGKQVTNVTLTVGQQASVDFRLQIGSQVQTVTVNESEELLNTSNAEISSVVSETTIKELPLNGRDPSSLIFLSPGVVNVLNTAAGYTQNSDLLAMRLEFQREAGNKAALLPYLMAYLTWTRTLD